MTGEELYSIHYDSMSEEASVLIEKWEDLSVGDRDAWDATAVRVNEEIDEAVVEALPGTRAGERTDV